MATTVKNRQNTCYLKELWFPCYSCQCCSSNSINRRPRIAVSTGVKQTWKYVAGLVGGIALTLAVGWQAMPGLMLTEYPSPYSVDDTVDAIVSNIKKAGWTVVSVKPVHEAVSSDTGVTRRPVHVIKLCQPEYARRILQQDSNLVVSAMMPCVISVYEKEDGKA